MDTLILFTNISVSITFAQQLKSFEAQPYSRKAPTVMNTSVSIRAFARSHCESNGPKSFGYTLPDWTWKRNLFGSTSLAGSRAAVGINKSPQRKVDTAACMRTANESLSTAAKNCIRDAQEHLQLEL